MRHAALNASTHQDTMQKAVAFHEQRVEEIENGDHELGQDPQLVAHVIPEGYPTTEALSAGTLPNEVPPNFLREVGLSDTHKYGEITKPQHQDHDQRAYGLLTHAGGIETVSSVEIDDFGGEEQFLASRCELKLAATVHWAQNTLEDEFNSDRLVVLVTLMEVSGEKIRIPDAVMVGPSEPTFSSDRVNPWPTTVSLESTPPSDAYDQLTGLFDRLWSDTGISGSVFYHDGKEAHSSMTDFLKV